MSEFIDALKQFVHKEYDTQNRQIREMWDQAIDVRVVEGEAIADLEIARRVGYKIVLRCRENLSKFRIADALLLNRGVPANGGIACILDDDRGEELTISPNFSNFQDLAPGGGWCLDRDMVDIRHILLGVLDTLEFTEDLENYFRDMFNGRRSPMINPQHEAIAKKYVKGLELNPSQEEAFIHGYATDNFYLIQGPPGTGKTWVLAYLAAALAESGERVLVTAFTHRAINNALRKIAKTTGWSNLLKIGQENYADDLTWESGTIPNYEKFEASPYSPQTSGLIVGGTCFAVRTNRLNSVAFDTVIFDEASQVTLPLAISGMLSGRKYIFIGDHKQMAPVVVGDHAQDWVTRSIFETLFLHSPGTMLDITYRMCAEINAFPSRRFYNSKLIPSPDAKARRLRLKQRPAKYAEILDPSKPDIFAEIRHTNRGMRSPEEAEAAASIALEAIKCGVDPAEIAIVAPYRAQCRLIRSRLWEYAHGTDLVGLENIVVDTVERIQGQERDMVIISLTTSDPGHATQRADFYFQPNRLNVAITRPKVKRIVLGSSLLFKATPKEKKLREWVEHFRALYEQSHLVVLG
jgi:DNA replication ATP-dependent helicase Dna2